MEDVLVLEVDDFGLVGGGDAGALEKEDLPGGGEGQLPVDDEGELGEGEGGGNRDDFGGFVDSSQVYFDIIIFRGEGWRGLLNFRTLLGRLCQSLAPAAAHKIKL